MPRKTTENTRKPKASERPIHPCGRVAVVVLAVVLTVMVDVFVANLLVPWKDAGLNAQVAPAGRPEQERLIAPLNPVDHETETCVVPEPPGAEMIIVGGADPVEAANPGVIVKPVGALLLALKLASPL